MKNINIMKNIHSFIKSNCGIGGISSVSRRFLVLFITLLSLGVGNAHAWGVYFNVSGWWANDDATFRVHYWWGDETGDVSLVSFSSGWYYAELPSSDHNWNFQLQRINPSDGEPWSYGGNIYDKGETYTVVRNGDNESNSVTGTHAGFQGGNTDRWIKVGANGIETQINPTNSSSYDVNIGSTVNLYLKEFGAWTWKHYNYSGKYGNVSQLTLNYLLGKDETGDLTSWHDTYTNNIGDGANTKDGVTYQPWKWTGDLDLLSNLKGSDKTTLSSGSYYLKYFWSASINNAHGTGSGVETTYFSRNGSNFYIHFTIPTPEVSISGRPYADIESIITAAPKSNTTIYGQTFQYKFEEWNGSEWVVMQDYSSEDTYTYTPTSTENKVRVKMKVVETNEESEYVEKTVYEQYYIYVEDTRDWGQMWMTMKNTDNNDFYLDREFPGEQLLPCDTIDGKPIYRIALDSYFHRLWLSVGNNTKQTYNDGFLINFDQGSTYGIKKENAGNYYLITTANNENNCFLTSYSGTLYRVVSYDGATGKTYYSNCISSTEGTGTISFFANTADASSTIYIQTWSNAAATENGLNGSWTTNTSTNYKDNCAAVSASGSVFTATLSSSTIANIAKYEGDYHIHVYATTKNYLTNGESTPNTSGTKFIKFNKSATFGDTYDHFWVDWFQGSQSVVATVGNEWNSNLANVLSNDAYAPTGYTTASGGNVRYGYYPSTNAFTRAIISGGGDDIKIKGNADDDILVYNSSTGTYDMDAYDAARSFSDASNWNYQIKAKVKGGKTADVTTTYNGKAQTLADNKKLIQGIENTQYTVEITYDFRTNRIIAAWTPDGGDIATTFDLQANMLVERVEDGEPTVLNITNNDALLTNVTQIYTAMKFTHDHWDDASRTITSGVYTDAYYWISLPYDCNVGDIFGIPGYGDAWVIQTYHGDYRAQQGWWAETDSWWYDMDLTGKMEANRGYVIRLTNLEAAGKPFNSGDITEIRLYFPSARTDVRVGVLDNSSITTKIAPLTCEKWNQISADAAGEPNHGAGNPRYDRRAIDSNWNLIGSPSFNTAKITTDGWETGSYPSEQNVEGTPLKYFFTWTVSAGAPVYTVQTAENYDFTATHAYLAQYAGDITWTPVTSNPLVGLKAPKRQEATQEQNFKITLSQEGAQADVAYISRMAEGATEDYDLNLDLSKLMNNRRANIYSFAGLYKMAGNCLPDTINEVALGVQVPTAGEYTFSIPDGTNGIGVTLIDNVANTRTNLALTDYTVTLEKGTFDSRFALEISPVKNTTTGLEPISGDAVNDNNGAWKRLIDNQLYIVRDGKVFDARGARIQ